MTKLTREQQQLLVELKGLVADLEGIAMGIEAGQPMADEECRVRNTLAAFNRAPMKDDTWRALAAIAVLEQARMRLAQPSVRADDEAERIVGRGSWVRGEPKLKDIKKDAWLHAVKRWKGQVPLGRGRPKAGQVPWYEVLFDLLKSAGICCNVTDPRNLGKQVERAQKRQVR